MSYTLILIGVAAFMFVSTLVFMASRYKRCPSDKLLVVYGKTSGGSARVYHGGGVFVWPVIQAYAYLDLDPMTINIPLEGALSKQNIRVNVPSTFTVAISTEESVRKNAAERLLGQNRDTVRSLVSNIILGQLRLVIAQMDIEEINTNRDKFLSAITAQVEAELIKVGLQLINSNIQDINDESGYIKALGQEAAAKAINEAKVSVAEKTRDGDIGQAKANKERSIQTANLQAEAEVGQAKANSESQVGKVEAESNARTLMAEANSRAIEGENKAAIHVANTTAQRNVAEAEANKTSTIAQNVAKAEAQERTYAAEKIAEESRAIRDKAREYANIVVPAEIAKQRMEVDAEASAEQIRRVAKGNADAVLMQKEAEAKGIKAVFEGQAEGFAKLVAAAGSPDKAIQMMLVEQLPELMRIQVDAIKNLKIDKVVVWDGMGGQGDGTTTGNWVNGLLKALPAYDELYKMTGNSLPSMLNVTAKPEDEK